MRRTALLTFALCAFWPRVGHADDSNSNSLRDHRRVSLGITYLAIPTASLQLDGSFSLGGIERDFSVVEPQLTESGKVHAIAFFAEVTGQLNEHTYAGLNWTFGTVFPVSTLPVRTSLSGLLFQLDERPTFYTSFGGILGFRVHLGPTTLRAQAQLGARWLTFKGGPVPLDSSGELDSANDGQVFLRPSILLDVWLRPRMPLTVGVSTDPWREGEFAVFLAVGRSSRRSGVKP